MRFAAMRQVGLKQDRPMSGQKTGSFANQSPGFSTKDASGTTNPHKRFILTAATGAAGFVSKNGSASMPREPKNIYFKKQF